MPNDRDGNDLASELYSASPAWLRLIFVPFNWLRKRSDPIKVIKLQEARKAELRAGLDFDPAGKRVPEAIIIRTSRRKRYPNKPPRLFNVFASDWFKVEIKAVSDQTLDVFSKITEISVKGKKARETFGDDEGEKAYIVGKIPLESIRYVQWEDDPAYNLPRLYIDYGPRGPAKEVAVYQGDRPDGYLYERLGLKFKPKRSWPWSHLAMNWRDRRSMNP